ncbi:vacuolar protein sorting [Cyclospora cayetanensis]|uniref:Vacuolar protein sorting n=1 Tax=Cyclospora cayetanensis TaxID=88456 RepID=A0A1D3CZ42_9EIME|nr:vacuolar protein sorting [Cyclospora cayetanensis]
MLAAGWGGGALGAPKGPDTDSSGLASGTAPIQPHNSSSSEAPSLQLRILRLGGGGPPSLHAKGGAAAAATAAGCTYIATVDGSLIRTDGDGQQVQTIEFPTFKEQLQLRRLFLSPSGAHLVAAAANGVTVYVHRATRTAVPLQRLKGKILECICWRPDTGDESTGTFLLGTRCGCIMECTVAGGKERHLRLLMQLPKSSPALDISVVSVGAGSESCVAVLVATDSELLCFQGVGGVAAAFSSNPNKNPPAALSEAVAYEVSSGSAAGPAATANASSSLAVDRTSSTDPQTAVFTVYWLTPLAPGHRPSPQQVVLFTWLLRLLLQQLNSIDAEALRAASPPLPPKTSAAAAETNVALEPSVATGGSSNEAALGEALQRTQQEIRHLLTEFKHVDELHSSGRTGLLRDFLLMRGDEETCARLFLNSAQYRDALAGVSTALLLLLAEAPDVSEEDLTSVIATQGNGGGGFDALLCLRHCQEKNRRRGVILLYVHLKRYQASQRLQGSAYANPF